MKRLWWIHPFLFGFYPVLFLLKKNYGEALPSDLPAPLLVIVGIVLLSLVINRLLFKSWERAAIITTVFIFLAFSFGHIKSLIPWFGKMVQDVQPLIRLMLWIFTFFVLPVLLTIFFTRGKNQNFETPTRALNVIALVMTLFMIVPIVQKAIQVGSDQRVAISDEVEDVIRPAEYATQLPDIYYIILDGYGRTETFENVYGFTNKPFLKELEQRGFYIARESQSNYDYTLHSLPSILNMGYIQDVMEGYDPSLIYYWPWYTKNAQSSKVSRFLKEKGYYHLHMGSSAFRPTHINQYADENFTLPQITDFERMVIKMSVIGKMESVLTTSGMRRNTLEILKKLKEVPERKESTYTFVHLVPPHPPYIFKADGSHYSPIELVINDGFKRKELYAAQTEFINNALLPVIDEIKAKSKVPPIIIIQGDHGPRPPWRGQLKHAKLGDADYGEFLDETMRIFNAYHVPESVKKDLYSKITPVNSFRILLNHLFGENFPLLAEKNYVPVEGTGFVEVTGKFKNG